MWLKSCRWLELNQQKKHDSAQRGNKQRAGVAFPEAMSDDGRSDRALGARERCEMQPANISLCHPCPVCPACVRHSGGECGSSYGRSHLLTWMRLIMPEWLDVLRCAAEPSTLLSLCLSHAHACVCLHVGSKRAPPSLAGLCRNFVADLVMLKRREVCEVRVKSA